MTDMSTIERALELAGTGRYRTIVGLKNALRLDKMEAIDAHLEGTSIRRQLVALMASAAARNSG